MCPLIKAYLCYSQLCTIPSIFKNIKFELYFCLIFDYNFYLRLNLKQIKLKFQNLAKMASVTSHGVSY